MQPAVSAALDPRAVLSKAVAPSAEHLSVSKASLAKVLGMSASTVTQLFAGRFRLDPSRKEWEFALLFVHLFRSLDSIVGNETTAQQWLTSDSLGLSARLIQLIANTEGLVRVIHYLDAARFRAETDPGVFYGAGSVRTAAAELSYWRWKFRREAVVGAIVYASVRDPADGSCAAVLTQQAFVSPKLLPGTQTWWLTVQPEQVVWRRDRAAWIFVVAAWG